MNICTTPDIRAQVPSQADLVDILTRCFQREASVNETAAAVRQLFNTAPTEATPDVEVSPPPGQAPFKELPELFVELAGEYEMMAELCSLEEHHPEKGRVPEFWVPRARYLAFFKSAVQLGERRAMASFPLLGRGVHDGFQRAQFTDAYLRLNPGTPDWRIGLAWRSEEAEAQRHAILLAAMHSPRADITGNQVTLTGHQLKQALALAWPDGEADPDQGFTAVTIANLPESPGAYEDGTAVDMPAGLYLSYDELPEEGMQLLREGPDQRADCTDI
jgi:hypothetical protein